MGGILKYSTTVLRSGSLIRDGIRDLGEMALVVKCLLHKNKDVSLNSRTCSKEGHCGKDM